MVQHVIHMCGVLGSIVNTRKKIIRPKKITTERYLCLYAIQSAEYWYTEQAIIFIKKWEVRKHVCAGMQVNIPCRENMYVMSLSKVYTY